MDTEFSSRKNMEIRNFLNQINLRQFKGQSEEDPTIREYHRLLTQSDKYDVMKLTTLSLVSEAFMNNLWLSLGFFYDDERKFYKSYDFLITDDSKIAKKIIKEYKPDFKISFKKFHLTNDNHLDYEIIFKSKATKKVSLSLIHI